MIWKDTTTYSRDAKERKPSCWSARSGPIEISVLKRHIYYPSDWVMHCHAIRMDTVRIDMPLDTPVERVQAIAVEMVRERLNVLLAQLD